MQLQQLLAPGLFPSLFLSIVSSLSLTWYLHNICIHTFVCIAVFFVLNCMCFWQDEIFHVPQAQQYCKGNFTSWDPMITTPPGLWVFFCFLLLHLIMIQVYFLWSWFYFLMGFKEFKDNVTWTCRLCAFRRNVLIPFPGMTWWEVIDVATS